MAEPADRDEQLSASWIAARYGGLVQAKDLSRLLGFSSPAGLRRAHATGRLPVTLFRLPGRRGWFAHATDVSAYLRAHTGGGE
mgnify:CR=1 FL=1